MLDPPMRNFGVPGLAKWADLLTAPRDPKGWPRLLAGLRGQVLDLAEAERQAATELKEPR